MEIKDKQEQHIKKKMQAFRRKVEDKLGKYSIIAFDFFYIRNYYGYVSKSFSLSVDHYIDNILRPFIEEHGSLGNNTKPCILYRNYIERKEEITPIVLSFKKNVDMAISQQGEVKFEKIIDHFKEENFGNSYFWVHNCTHDIGGYLSNSLCIVFQKNIDEEEFLQLKGIYLDVFLSEINTINQEEWIKITEEKKIPEHFGFLKHTLINLINPHYSRIIKNENFVMYDRIGIILTFISIYGICASDEESRNRIGDLFEDKKSPEELIAFLIDYYNSAFNEGIISMRIESEINPSKIELKPDQKLDFITLVFNLLDNAKKAGAPMGTEMKVIINAQKTSTGYCLVIENPNIIPDNVLSFYNYNDKINMNKYILKEQIKKTGGLVIVKKIVAEHNWKISAEILNNKSSKISLKIE